MDAEYGELLLHSDVQWLSRGKALARFWILKTYELQFLREIDFYQSNANAWKIMNG